VKFLTRLSVALVAVSLAFPLWTSLYLIPLVQPERGEIAAGKLRYMFSCENWVHEAGFARLAISIIALLILFIPYRKGERWAFAALVILAFVYYVPVFYYGAIPNLGTWPFFQRWHLPQAKTANLTLEWWTVLLVTASLLLGLAISVPVFFRKNQR
jgi:hypothetical protein